MTFQAGQIENSLARPTSSSNIHSNYSRKIKFIVGKRRLITRDATGTFRTNYSITNGPDVTISSYESLPSITKYYNDNGVFNRVFTAQEDLIDSDWIFDYDNGLITSGLDVINSSEPLVDDGNTYANVSITTINAPLDWESDISLYLILSDSSEVLVGWNEVDKVITPSTSISYKLVNSHGMAKSYDMFDSVGRPLIVKITYY